MLQLRRSRTRKPPVKCDYCGSTTHPLHECYQWNQLDKSSVHWSDRIDTIFVGFLFLGATVLAIATSIIIIYLVVLAGMVN